MIVRFAAIALAFILAACGSSPAAPSGPVRSCRRYPAVYTDNGVSGHCEFAPGRVDVARRAVASNGELQVQDADGNVIEEIEFSGSPAHVITIQERAEVCE